MKITQYCLEDWNDNLMLLSTKNPDSLTAIPKKSVAKITFQFLQNKKHSEKTGLLVMLLQYNYLKDPVGLALNFEDAEAVLEWFYGTAAPKLLPMLGMAPLTEKAKLLSRAGMTHLDVELPGTKKLFRILRHPGQIVEGALFFTEHPDYPGLLDQHQALGLVLSHMVNNSTILIHREEHLGESLPKLIRVTIPEGKAGTLGYESISLTQVLYEMESPETGEPEKPVMKGFEILSVEDLSIVFNPNADSPAIY